MQACTSISVSPRNIYIPRSPAPSVPSCVTCRSFMSGFPDSGCPGFCIADKLPIPRSPCSDHVAPQEDLLEEPSQTQLVALTAACRRYRFGRQQTFSICPSRQSAVISQHRHANDPMQGWQFGMCRILGCLHSWDADGSETGSNTW